MPLENLAIELQPDEAYAAAAICARLAPSIADKPLSDEIVWMPKGTHEISAFMTGGGKWQGTVICDEAGARSVAESFARIIAKGQRVRFDEAHTGDAATFWPDDFRWDPVRGIIAKGEWTSLGEELVRGKVYTSFSPEFLVNKTTKRVAAIGGRVAGGLVNEPAFGAAMPAIIQARLNGAAPTTTQYQDHKHTMKELLVKVLAALKVEAPANATEETLVSLCAKHIDRLPEAGAEGVALKAHLAELTALKAKEARLAQAETELTALRAADSTRRKADAKAAVDTAVARGALPAKDEAIQAKWAAMIEANPDHAQLLASLPDNPALTRITTPTAGLITQDNLVPVLQALKAKSTEDVDVRATIYHRDIAPFFAKNLQFNQELSHVLAANSLGTLAGELVSQRTFTLLKLQFPWLFEITTDFSSEGATFGQVVRPRLRALPTRVAYVPGTGYVRSDANTTDAPVTINHHEGVEIAFNVNELSSTNRDLFGEQIEGAHYVLGNSLVGTLLALITAANFANATTQATATLTPANSMDLMDAALGTRGAYGPRVGLLSSAVFRRLGNDSTIVTLAQFQMKEVITQSMLPPIKNIKPYEVFNLPTTANLTGFAGTSEALAIATRVPNDYSQGAGGQGGSVQTVKNIDTGISAQLVRYVDHRLAESAWRLALMWGVGVGDAAKGQRLISA